MVGSGRQSANSIRARSSRIEDPCSRLQVPSRRTRQVAGGMASAAALASGPDRDPAAAGRNVGTHLRDSVFSRTLAGGRTVAGSASG